MARKSRNKGQTIFGNATFVRDATCEDWRCSNKRPGECKHRNNAIIVASSREGNPQRLLYALDKVPEFTFPRSYPVKGFSPYVPMEKYMKAITRHTFTNYVKEYRKGALLSHPWDKWKHE